MWFKHMFEVVATEEVWERVETEYGLWLKILAGNG